MDLIQIRTPDFVFQDNRGELAQLVHSDYQQVNAVFTKKGAVRGNYHYHKQTDELFYVLAGKIHVSARSGEKVQSRTFGSGDMFSIQEGVRHHIDFLEDTYLVVLYRNPVEKPGEEKDIWPD